MFKKSLALTMTAVMVVTLFTGCAPKKDAAAPAAEPAKATVSAREVVKDVKVRKALTLAIDRTAIVETVTKGGQVPATGFVPNGLKLSDGTEMRKVAGDYGIDPMKANIEEAKKLLAEAGYPDGKGFPTLTILYNTLEAHKSVAEAIQEMWKKNLNIKVELSNQEWAVFQDTRHQGNYEVARGGWIGDYEDPMTFLDLWTSYSGNNDAHWYKKAYDELIEKSKLTTGKERDALLLQAEKMIMDDNITMPIYYYTKPIQVKDEVKDWYVALLGQWDFSKASAPGNVLKWNLGSDPKTIDPGLCSANDGGNIINQTFEGLMRKDATGLKPAAAESYTVSPDGKTYTFKIRKDAKWSDGKALTAQDFEYAWKRVLDPKNAAEYSFQMYYIKGAQPYYEGKGKLEEVAIKATDDKTLVVELNAPTPYFLDLTGFYTFMPVRKDMVEKNPDGWTKDPKLAVSNGAFKLTSYKAGDSLVLEANKSYWNNKATKLTKILAKMIVDQSTSLTAYESGDIQVNEQIPLAEIPRLQAEDKTFKILPYVGTYYYMFNIGDKK